MLVPVAYYGATSSHEPEPWASLRTLDAHSLSFASGDPSRLLFGHHQGVFESRDGGRTWTDLRADADAMGMQIGPDGSTFIAGHLVFKASTDGGRTWTDVVNDLPNTDIHGFARDPVEPTRMWAYLATGGVFESTDTGAHWQQVFADNVLYLNAVSASTGTRLIGVDFNGLSASADGGRTWQTTGAPPDYPISSLTASPDGVVVLLGSPSGLYRSDDGGMTWASTGFREQPFAIAIANGGKTVALVTRFGSFYRSDDGGRTWPGS